MSKKQVGILLAFLILTVPFAYWTTTPTSSLPKIIITVLVSVILLMLHGYHTFSQKKLSLPSITSFLPPLLLLSSIAGSLLFNPEGRPEAIIDRGIMYLALSIIAVISILHHSAIQKKYALTAFTLTGSLLSLHSLASLLFLYKSPYVPGYMQYIAFTPTGSYQTTLILILVSIAILFYQIKNANNKIILASILVFNLIAVVAVASLMLPNGALSPTLPSYLASWSMALDGVKSIHSLFTGVGISNYSSLYTAVKPLSINQTNTWNLLQTSATSELLTLLPTAGVVAMLSLVYFLVMALYRTQKSELFAAMLILAIGIFTVPANLTLYLYIYLIYTISTDVEPYTFNLNLTSAYLSLSIYTLIGLTLLYPFSTMLISEYYLGRADRALKAGNSQEIYNNTLSAISFSPKIANNHLSFADVNFRLASALSQKPDLTDADRQTISQLISQSITSTKTAIKLRPNDSRAHLALAKIYQNLINVASGAEAYAIESYSRALSLDRANPSLRVEFAGLLSSVAEIEKNASISGNLRARAVTELQTALQLKKDYGNAYYNLAAVLEKSGQQSSAIVALEETLKYLQTDSQDYLRVKAELETLKSTNPQNTPKSTNVAPSSELSSPTPLPNQIDGGPINLPNP